MANTFEILRCCLHPATRLEDLHDTMLLVHQKMVETRHPSDEFVDIRGFVEQYPLIAFKQTSRVAGHDGPNNRDPICVLEITFENERDALLFKMWKP